MGTRISKLAFQVVREVILHDKAFPDRTDMEMSRLRTTSTKQTI